MKRVIFFLILLTVSLATVEAKTPGIRSSQVGNVSSLISEGLQQINFMDNNTLSDMKIRVSDGLNTITYKLNETSAAKSLYQMLPLKVTVENYSNNEKIFYPHRGGLPCRDTGIILTLGQCRYVLWASQPLQWPVYPRQSHRGC